VFTLVLAGSTQEALTFARDVGLTRPRVATAAHTLQGLRISNVVELPSFWRRPDKHAILSAIRPLLARDRSATHVLYEEWVPPKDRPLEGQMTIEDAIRETPPVVGEVVQSTGRRAASQTSKTPRPTSVSAIKAARASRTAK
jgi:hypothetical protein